MKTGMANIERTNADYEKLSIAYLSIQIILHWFYERRAMGECHSFSSQKVLLELTQCKGVSGVSKGKSMSVCEVSTFEVLKYSVCSL